MKTNTKIYKYIKLSLFSNFIFLDNFAYCKKGDKSGSKNGYSVKKALEDDKTEQQSNENENPDNPDDTNKFIQKRNDFKTKLNNIYTRNNFLPDNKITVDKEDLLNKIDKIKSDTEVNDINKELDTLESKLTNALTNLKQDYINRLKEIINGNSKLNLGLDINLNEKTINNLDFGENIKNIKTDLVNLETQYFKKLKNKCKNLKTKYNNLKPKIDKIENQECKNIADNLCSNLTDASFDNIKKYETYEHLNQQITNIQLAINNNINEIINNYKTECSSNLETAKNTTINADILNIEEISDSISNIKNKIENIKTIEDKNNVDKSIEELTTKIKNKNFISTLKTEKGIPVGDDYPYIHLCLNKEHLKLYHKENLIAESTNSVKEVDIKKINDTFEYDFNLNLKFKDVEGFGNIEIGNIAKLKDILENYKKNIYGELKRYYDKTEHLLLKLKFKFNNKKDICLYYDFNTKNMFDIYVVNNESILLGCYINDIGKEKKIMFKVDNAYNLKTQKYGYVANNIFVKKDEITQVTDNFKETDFNIMSNFQLEK